MYLLSVKITGARRSDFHARDRAVELRGSTTGYACGPAPKSRAAARISHLGVASEV